MRNRILKIFFLMLIVQGCSKIAPTDQFSDLQLMGELGSRRFLPYFQSEGIEADGVKVYSSKNEVLKITLIQSALSDGAAAEEILARVKALIVLHGQKPRVDAKNIVQNQEYFFCGDHQQYSRLANSDGEFSIFFDLRATKKFAYSLCSERVDVWRSQYQLLYCRNSKNLYEIRVFYPRLAARIMAPVAKCR